MYLSRRNPSFSLPTFQDLQREMNHLLDEASQDWNAARSDRTWAPVSEIYDTDEDLVITVELPGLKRGDVNIAFENGQLILTGERKLPEDERRTYHRNERVYGRFERSFQLTETFDVEKIKAKLRHGILTVTLSKKEEAKPRQISISAG